MTTENNKTDAGLVLIVSATDSFLAKSLVNKLNAGGLEASFSRGNIGEIEKIRENIELIILFLGSGMEDMTESLVYLKDTAGDLDRKMIMIGDAAEYDIIRNIIPETLVLEWFKRPLVMDDLLKCIHQYMKENTGENRKKTILIVDDDITYMRTVFEWLKEDYHVGMASNGVQAIGYLARNHADLVLLDYEMPVADGPQVLQMLKNDSQTDHIPVMFLTGHSDRDSVMSAVGLKPADYLLKTIDKESLRKRLKEFFDVQLRSTYGT